MMSVTFCVTIQELRPVGESYSNEITWGIF